MSAAREYVHHEHVEWLRPPAGGWTADDLDKLPNLPPHTELIDGSLILMSPQTFFHMAVLRLLENAMLAQVPEGFAVIREMTTKLTARDRPEPDLMVVSEDALTGPGQTWYEPESVLLAVEIVSADSIDRDREVKPHKYARAGIPHFWRVEESDGLPVVHVYELDPAARSYSFMGIHHKQLKLERPFPLDVDLSTLSPRPTP
ncbi:Uma2 family endonuclease [Streptomyces amakusaensis]|uniref:Uma2 family endonuclease n=1 Tax=Streptomyces amakusaensis TaxID=67271 RepID=A0ABW0ABS5_9ACTN